MKRKLLSVLLVLAMLAGVLAGCTGDGGTDGGTQDPGAESGEGGETTGDLDNFVTQITGKGLAPSQEVTEVYSLEVETLNYLISTNEVDFAVTANMIDSLVDYDNYGVMVPGLAESWEVSEDGLVYTFTLRDGVKWMNLDGDEYADLVAQDFVDAMEYVLDQSNASSSASFAYNVLLNGRAYYEGEITDFTQVGVKALDEKTVEYTLEQPYPYFLSLTTYMCFWPVNGEFLEAMGEDFGTSADTILSCGAYLLESYEPQVRRILVKNPSYWDAGNVHVNKITKTYNKEASSVEVELYKRGEVTRALEIPASLLTEWMEDEELSQMIHPAHLSYYTYFYSLNYDPHFAAEYEPDNWKLAVNTTSFRKTLFYAVDRVAAMMTVDPYNPERIIINTITPPNFTSLGGVDFVDFDPLNGFTDDANFLFDEELALQWKETAVEELTEKGATFPIKMLMPYNTSYPAWGNRCTVLKQQLENLLGDDFIEVVILDWSQGSFLDSTRRAGNYAIQESNNEASYIDPLAYTVMFTEGNKYNFFFESEEVDGDGNNLYDVYQGMIDEADAEVLDMQRRYELFAQAEAYLLENAIVIPFGYGVLGADYTSTPLTQFEFPYSPLGISETRWKYVHVYDSAFSSEEYQALREHWEQERVTRTAAAGQ